MSKVKKICILSMLIGASVVLGAYLTLRVGGAIKITFKFVAVFLAAYLFGAVPGGVAAAISDVISYILVPTGPFLPMVSAVEFIYGFVFGVFFHKKDMKILKIILCAAAQMLVINLFGTSYFLKVYFGGSYTAAIIGRLPSAVINMVIQIVILAVLRKNNSLKKAVENIG